MMIADLLKRAGVPDGVFNVVHGDHLAVDALLAHPDVSAVSFVGSTPIAQYVYERGAREGKRVQALGGAKNHMIVLPDADVEMAADAAVSAAYGSAGERCMAISQVVAVGDVGDALVAAISGRLPRIVAGDGMRDDTQMGPLITRAHRDRVASYIDRGREQGAELLVDGRDGVPAGEGFFLGVTLLDRVTPDMDVYRDEIFGPVLGVTRVDSYDEALRLVNENPFGNGAAIFTRDGGAARRFAFDAQVGMLGVNVPIPVPVAYYSFGGWKASLFGDSHIYGPEAMGFYTRGKIDLRQGPTRRSAAAACKISAVVSAAPIFQPRLITLTPRACSTLKTTVGYASSLEPPARCSSVLQSREGDNAAIRCRYRSKPSRWSASKRPRHHQRELFSPKRVAVRPDPLGHDNVRTCIAQRVRPPGRVLEEERLLHASDEVRARKRARHHRRRSVPCARRRAKDRAVDVGMAKPHGERELSTRRDTEHRGSVVRQRDVEARLRPSAHVLDKELLVCREPFSVKGEGGRALAR